MERFKNILFASSGEKEDAAALDRANRLALSNQARITLTKVIEEIPLAASYFFSKERLARIKEATETLAWTELKKLAEQLDPSLKVEIKVLTGKPFLEMIRAVLGQSHDILIKPGRTLPAGNSLDSTDLHLLRKCPCPVWIIKPSQRKPFGKILVAVDPDPTDPERLSLHADLVKLGTSLAKNEGGRVEVVHSWQFESESTLLGPRFGLSEDEVALLRKEVEATHRKWLKELIAPYDVQQVKTSLIRGTADTSLINFIEKKKPDILVMGTVARTGLPGLLIGNTAEAVLGRISCSVLTIKPKNFKTPVS